MSAMDHSTLLTKLIIAGESVVQMRAGALELEALEDLIEGIRAEYHKPSESPQRVIDDRVLMCASAVKCADHHLRRHTRKASRPFVQVVGVLLPEVRHALELAIEQRKRPTA